MKISPKRLHKIKKSNNQSHKIRKRKNKHKRNKQRSFRKKRGHLNLKNRSLKMKRGGKLNMDNDEYIFLTFNPIDKNDLNPLKLMNIKREDLLKYNESKYLLDSLVVYNKDDNPTDYYLNEIKSKDEDNNYTIKQITDSDELIYKVHHNKINQLTFNYELLQHLGKNNMIEIENLNEEKKTVLYTNLSKPWKLAIRNINGKTIEMTSLDYLLRTWNHDHKESGIDRLRVIIQYAETMKDHELEPESSDEEMKELYYYTNIALNIYIINHAIISYLFNFPEKIKELKTELINNFSFSELENFFKKNKIPLLTGVSFIPPKKLVNKESNDYHYRWRMPFEFSIISKFDKMPFFNLDDSELQSFREELKLLKNKHSEYPLIKNYQSVISNTKNKVDNLNGYFDDKSDFSSSSINIEEEPEEDIEAEPEDTVPEPEPQTEEEKEEEPEPQTEEEKEEEPESEEDDEDNFLNDFDFEIPEIPSESKNEGMTTNISRKNKESIQIYVEKGNDGANDEIRAFVDLGGNPEEWFNALITSNNDTEGGDDNNEEGGDDDNEEGGDDDNEEGGDNNNEEGGDNNNEEGGDDNNEEGGDDDNEEGGDDDNEVEKELNKMEENIKEINNEQEEDDSKIREKEKKQLEKLKLQQNEINKKLKSQQNEINNFN